MLARKPLRTPAGPTMLVVVAIFGVGMIVFGLSKWLPLSLAALVRHRLRRHDQREHPRDGGRAR